MNCSSFYSNMQLTHAMNYCTWFGFAIWVLKWTYLKYKSCITTIYKGNHKLTNTCMGYKHFMLRNPNKVHLVVVVNYFSLAVHFNRFIFKWYDHDWGLCFFLYWWIEMESLLMFWFCHPSDSIYKSQYIKNVEGTLIRYFLLELPNRWVLFFSMWFIYDRLESLQTITLNNSRIRGILIFYGGTTSSPVLSGRYRS